MPVSTDTLETREFKLRAAKVDEEGTFTGYASTFGNTDAYGDTFAPGAFRKTLADQPTRPLLWAHAPDEPIGVAELREDAKGLRVTGRLVLDVARAREAHALMKAGALRGISIGFLPRKFEWKSDGSGRTFSEVELHEVSLTPLPANPRAVVTDVRAKPAVAAEKGKEITDMEMKEAVAPIEQKVNEIAGQLSAIAAKLEPETRAVAPALLGRAMAAMEGGGFAERFISAFNEKRSLFDAGGRLRFTVPHPLLEVREITRPVGLPAAPEPEIGRAAGAPAGSLLELIPRRPIDAAAAFVLRESASTGWAAGMQTEGSAKAESDAAFSGAVLPVRTIATWVAATRQALDDIEGLSDFIEARLRWALLKLLEQQVLSGSGAAEDLHGLLPQAQTWTPPTGVTYDLYGRLVYAATQVEVNGFRPTAVIVHPNDYRTITLQRDDMGQYVQPPAGVPRMVPCAAMTAGTFLVGDFSQCVLRVRQDVTIDISTEHSDFFTKNKAAIRAEQRCALVVYSPSAFIKGTLTE